MSVFEWILGLMINLAGNMVWGCLVGGVLYLLYRAFRGNK